MHAPQPDFELRLAKSAEDLRAAQRLRYEVFVRELGGAGAGVDHAEGLEADRFDPHFEHLLLIDRNGPGVVGVYRIMDRAGAARAGGFYSEGEFDLSPLTAGNRILLELGRSCLHPDYRGGAAMYHLWHGLARLVHERGVEVLFGAASFPGADPAALAQPLSCLHHDHLAPPELRARARSMQRMDLLAVDAIDRRAAMLATPALIKAYLRLGGVVGEGAFVDRAFNTIDVCLILDVARMNAGQRAIYTRGIAP